MSELTIPFHLAVPSVLCLIGLILVLIWRRRLFTGGRRTVLWVSITIFLLIYLTIVGTCTYDDMYAQWELNQYDPDRDGFFSGEEITSQQAAAMQRLTNDVGRNFSFITAAIFAFGVSAVVFVVGRLAVALGQKR